MAWTLRAELVFFCREQAKTNEEIVAGLQGLDKEANEIWITELIADCVRVGLLQRMATPQNEVYQTTKLGQDEMARYQAMHSPYSDRKV